MVGLDLSETSSAVPTGRGRHAAKKRRRLGNPPGFLGRHPAGALSSGTFLLVLAVVLLRNTYLFSTPVHEDGDFALNSFLVNRASEHPLLVGPVSRTGFPHPGPALLYVISLGQWIFHDFLHLVPAQFNGQILGDIVLQAFLFALISGVVYRTTRSIVATAVTVGVSLWFAAAHVMLADPWLPYVYMTIFALFLISAAATAAGHTRELSGLLFACWLLVHGHVSFVVFTGVTLVLVSACWLWTHRRDGRSELSRHRRWLAVGLAVSLVFAAPLIVQLIQHWPSPWKDYLQYSRKRSADPQDLGPSWQFLLHYWRSIGIPTALYAIAAVGAVAALVLDADRRRRRFFGFLYATLAVETGLFYYYIVRGVDALAPVNYYVGYFYLTVPMFLLAGAAAHAGTLGAEALAVRTASPRPIRYAVAGLAITAFSVVAGFAHLLGNPYRGSADYPVIAAAVRDAPDRAGRGVEVDFEHDDWSIVAGLFDAARRAHLPMCLAPTEASAWAGYFTPQQMCSPTGSYWKITIGATPDKLGTVVSADQGTVVVRPTLHPRGAERAP